MVYADTNTGGGGGGGGCNNCSGELKKMSECEILLIRAYGGGSALSLKTRKTREAGARSLTPISVV